MVKKWIALGSLFAVAAFIIVSGITGCGQQTSTTTTTPVTVASVSIKGSSSSTSTSGSAAGFQVRALGVLGTAEVIIGYVAQSSEAIVELKRGTTTADGTYEVQIPVASLEALKATSGYVPNLIVTISREGTVIGCVIPSVSPEAGKANFAPTASPSDYVKQKIAIKSFKKGMDPKSFDYTTNIDQKFSGSTSLDNYSDAKVDQMAASIKSGDDAEAKIVAGLGITDATIPAKMKQKAMELSRTYIEPIMQAAFTSKTPPNRSQMDIAMASMEVDMKAYAISLGLNNQQFSDMKSMKDKQIETKMTEGGVIDADDTVFKESKRRMMGNKVVTLFLGQYDAADTIATIKPTGKNSFATANASAYSTFQSSKEVIKAQLNTYLNTANLSPDVISSYLRTNFFDAYILNPPTDNVQEKEGGGFDPASMEAKLAPYTNSRIMIYFMQTFLDQTQRTTYFTSQESAMRPIFTNRFSNESSLYYMGEKFWNGTLAALGGQRPTADQIQARLTLYNAALDAAMDNNTALSSVFVAAGFTSAQATTILKSFRILMSPPDAMI